MSYVWVAIGSAVGGVARFWCSIAIASRAGEQFPWATLFVNAFGSFLIGLLAALAVGEGRWHLPVPGQQLLMVGVLGGFTTFSAFSLQTMQLVRAAAWLSAIANVLLSVGSCLLAVAVGFALASHLNKL